MPTEAAYVIASLSSEQARALTALAAAHERSVEAELVLAVRGHLSAQSASGAAALGPRFAAQVCHERPEPRRSLASRFAVQKALLPLD